MSEFNQLAVYLWEAGVYVGVMSGNELGELVAQRREDLGLKQWQVAEHISQEVPYTPQAVSNIERGITKLPDPKTLGLLAEVLQLHEIRLLWAAGYLRRTFDAVGYAIVPREPSGEELFTGPVWDRMVRHFGGKEQAQAALARMLAESYDR